MTGHPGRLPGMTKVWVATMGHSTGYSAVDAVLEELLAGVRARSGRTWSGVYLGGSLAAGDFAENSSDIDVLVVTEDAPEFLPFGAT
jgi:predicted nucleotidyltransferase